MANLSVDDVQSLENVFNFEYSQYAGGSTLEDQFYDLSDINNDTIPDPGTLLRVEDFTDITNYSLASELALSRILYVSKDINGSSVPASAAILWPFSPRQILGSNDSCAPTVIWNHDTSGIFPPSAPSKHRTIWLGDNSVFPLALAGYAVVAPDFVGLGVSRNFSGAPLQHQYITAPAQANDGIYAFRAARAAFAKRISRDFVVMGHSQGGGSSWGFAELMAREPDLADGYLGSVAASPVTDAFSAQSNFIAPYVGSGLSSIFPSFELSNWLTPFGLARLSLMQKLNGSLATGFELLTTTEPVALPGYNDTWYATQFAALANPSRRLIQGPMLVIQGTRDVFVNYDVTVNSVNATCALFPQNQIQFQVVNGTGHVPTLDATRQVWMQWIEDRFNKKPLSIDHCGESSTLYSFLPLDQYQATGNSFVDWAGSEQYSYQIPLAL